MSGQQLTINGGYNGQTGGLVSVSSAFSGASSVSGSINAMLQDYLNNAASAIAAGSLILENDDVAIAQDNFYDTVSGVNGLQEFTDTDSTGAPAGTSVNAFFLTPTGTSVVVEAPGNETLTGNGSPTNFLLFGQNSNVDYTMTNGAPASIFAAGGADSITLLNDQSGNYLLNDTIWSAGNDTMNLWGQGSVTANSETGAHDYYSVDDANTTITASGNATVGIHWRNVNSGGNLDFINNSTVAATVYSSVFDSVAAGTHVTAYGGAGGGFFVGGQGNGITPNLLVGGAVGSVSVDSTGNITQMSMDSTVGAVTLVGASSGDVLEAQSAQANDLFAGSGSETLIATSTTGSNLFQLGLTYHGLGEPPSNGVVSTDGSGTQNIFLGNSLGATIYGSTALTAQNYYDFVGDSTAGGGVFTIENFSSTNSAIQLINAGFTGGGDASIAGIFADPLNSSNTLIGLSDGTRITLVNVSASSVTTISGGAGGITKII